MAGTLISHRDVGVSQGTFRVAVAGDPGSPALLFLHGSGPGVTGLANWRAVLDELAADFYCIAPDVLGFGDSTFAADPPLGNGPITELRVSALIELLSKLQIPKVTLVGNSMGGLWSMGITRQSPDVVERIVLMGSAGAPGSLGPDLPALITFYDDPSEVAMLALIRSFIFDDANYPGIEEMAEERLELARRDEIRAAHLATFDMSKPWDLTDADMRAVQQDVLLIHGREDTFVLFDGSVFLFRQFPNAQLLGIGRCGHWAQLEHHDAFVTALRNFVKGEK